MLVKYMTNNYHTDNQLFATEWLCEKPKLYVLLLYKK